MMNLIVKILCMLLCISCVCAEVDISQHSATIPQQKTKKDGSVDSWWTSIYERQLAEKKSMKRVDILFIGDSITHGWSLKSFPKARFPDKEKAIPKGLAVWNEHYKNRHVLNIGISGDRTEHVLWRLQNGMLKGISPKVATLTIGHNNGKNTVVEIADGMQAILQEVRKQCPQTKIMFIPHFPTTGKHWMKAKAIIAYHDVVKRVKDDGFIIPTDLNKSFLNEEGVLKDSDLIPDNTHPAESGYRVWQKAMEPTLSRLLKEK